jgi:ribonuclease HII
MLVAGIDEAGRGPVLGPLVLALVVFDKALEDHLYSIGVRDSKQLSAESRLKLAAEIKKLAEEYAIVKIEPQELNNLMARLSLNDIEAMKCASLLNSLRSLPELVVVDSPEPLAHIYTEKIKRYLGKDLYIRSEHKADKRHVVVAAASILAKVYRDKSMDELARYYGEIGSGYCHDPRTKSFLETWVKKHKCLPPIARCNWRTSVECLDSVLQKSLLEFGGKVAGRTMEEKEEVR